MKYHFLTCAVLIFLSSVVIAQDNTTPTPQWRPVYHFTPAKNWTNDPNGLIFLNGVYHLYNQQNPFENQWGHMSWGHATSTDLVHWKHLPVAIPETIDKDTTWRYSGCAVWDKNNTSGFCKTGGCIVAIYTADQPNLKKESQFIAYSNDGGLTYTNYKNNPVIDLQKKDFRDPSVTWNEETKKWVMVVSLPVEHKLQFYASPNLKQWNLLSEFGPAGYTSAAWECPSLMQVPLEGNPAKKKWVLAISAAGAERGVFIQYFVGTFDGKTFRNDNPDNLILPVDYGDCFYAAIPWNEIPQHKQIYIGWMVPPPQPTYPWRGQMSVPRDLTLRQTKEGLRLIQKPTAVIQNNLAKLSGKDFELTNVKISDTEKNIPSGLSGNAYWLDAVLTVTPGTNAGFKIARQKDKDGKIIQETIVGYNTSSGKIYVDKTNSGAAKPDKDKLLLTTDMPNTGNTIRLQILFDKSSLEVFCNNGEKVVTTYIFPGETATGLSVFAEHGSAIIKSLKIWDLSGVNKK
ncbi:MAG: glycoside hydrolase family 32 protein [Bacteroidota bacterium]